MTMAWPLALTREVILNMQLSDSDSSAEEMSESVRSFQYLIFYVISGFMHCKMNILFSLVSLIHLLSLYRYCKQLSLTYVTRPMAEPITASAVAQTQTTPQYPIKDLSGLSAIKKFKNNLYVELFYVGHHTVLEYHILLHFTSVKNPAFH